jgi:alpha-tubulin suppressor-like RCC1 family protein
MKYTDLLALLALTALCAGCPEDDPTPQLADADIDATGEDVGVDAADTETEADAEDPVELRIRPDTIRLAEGNDLSIRVYDGFDKLEIAEVELTTSDAAIAQVSAEGLVHAVSAGTFEVIARYEGAEARIDGEVVAPRWVDVDVSTRHTCALDATGQVFCAGGFEADGEFEMSPRRTEGKLVALDHEEAFTDIALAFRTVCALDTSGRPWCRGRRLRTADDDGPTVYSNSFELVGTPSQVAFTQLVAGEGHFCALSDASKVWCWGANFYKQLGDARLSELPSPVALPGTMASVTAGGWHTCALTTEGRTFCWGANRGGQLGLGHQYGPKSPGLIAFDYRFDKLAAGRMHTCGLQGTDVYCWGYNGSYQVGTDRGTIWWEPTHAGTTNVTSVFAAHQSTCALRADGQAICWGQNDQGQLGDDEFLDRQTPRPIEGAAFSHLAMSATHSCGLTLDGELRCWGFDAAGSLAVGRQTIFEEPQRVDARGGSVDAGSLHTCRVVDETVECWGSNLQAQFGNGRYNSSSRPTAMTSGWRDVAAGSSTSCGVKDDELFCWGVEYDRELGMDDDFNVVIAPTRNNFTQVPDRLEITYSSVMVQSGDETYWWGAGHTINDVQAVVEGASASEHQYFGLDAPTVGGEHGCGLRRGSDGVVHCWGEQTLRGDPQQDSSYSHVAYPVDSQARFDALAAGRNHTCGLTTDDKLMCWGRVIPGAGLAETPTEVNSAVTLETLYGGGTYFGCGLDAAGKAYCWGKNFSGALGDGTSQDRAEPTPVAGDLTFRELTLGGNHACGVTIDDEVYCWGDNGYGQLGIGGRLFYAEPQPVVTAP